MNSRKQDKDSKETELQNIRHDHYGVFVHNYAKYEDPDDDNKEDGSGGKKADSAAVFSSDPSAAAAGGGEGKFPTASGSTENNMEAIQNLLEENVWHGLVTIAIYMGVGVLAYSYVFENWSVVDSLYFSMVTFTTVGYGDISPETQWGRLFTSVYAVSGIAIIGTVVGKIGEYVADSQLKAMRKSNRKLEENTMNLVQGNGRISSLKMQPQGSTAASGGGAAADTDTTAQASSSPEEDESALVAFSKIAMPYLLLIIPFLLGAAFEGRDQNWTFIDTLYYTICTITTVGYGDLSPDDAYSRMFAVFFVPMSAFALASVLSKFAAFSAERKIMKTQESIIYRGLRMSDLDMMDKDGDGEVSKLEFFEFMLLSMDKVDRSFLDRLHSQFESLDQDGNGTLSKSDLVAKVQASEQSRQDAQGGGSPFTYESPSGIVV
eukprot:CAMPEP_0116018690 /NCGR_PEP_ID=MMETSP0321-20121206/8795_1 /TAXON_ID=163516 /ORGANISM="Leptocylindrus danicus var. danicus, Strain B650" /LENGTH=433 /DNA_ID=CAMNT_0003489125 /DNA_START=46 /DNA_END=1347 /DNA_ORIENTATION=-